MSSNMPIQTTREREAFHKALPSIIDNLMNSPKMPQSPELASQMKKILVHNLSGNKHESGLLTVSTYKLMERPKNITEENLKLAIILGWCVEMCQCYISMIDDNHGSSPRQEITSWHNMSAVDMSAGAGNVASFIFCCIMEILEIYFLNTPYFIDITKLFHEAKLYASMGLHLENTISKIDPDYTLYTKERYATIVRFKTSNSTFRLPMHLGITLAKKSNKSLYQNIDNISYNIGQLYQIQDDYIDCYGDEIITGNIGTDIQARKCTWLAVTALQLCDKSERDIFTRSYGSKDPEQVTIIKNLYNKLRLPELFKAEQKEIYEDVNGRVRALPSATAPNVFYKLLNSIYKRNL